MILVNWNVLMLGCKIVLLIFLLYVVELVGVEIDNLLLWNCLNSLFLINILFIIVWFFCLIVDLFNVKKCLFGFLFLNWICIFNNG